MDYNLWNQIGSHEYIVINWKCSKKQHSIPHQNLNLYGLFNELSIIFIWILKLSQVFSLQGEKSNLK